MPHRRIEDDENFMIRCSELPGKDTERLQSVTLLVRPDQQLFVEKLFRRDPACLDKLLIKLEAAPDWIAAHRLIEAHFAAHHINPYQPEATRFSNIIYKRYFPKDEHI